MRLAGNYGASLTVLAASPSAFLKEKPVGDGPAPNILATVENLPAVEPSGLYDHGSRSGTPLEIGEKGVPASAWGTSTPDAFGVSVESQTRQTSPLLPFKDRLPTDLTTAPRSLAVGNTVYMASERLERRSKRFGCVWLSLIALPSNATASDCTARELYTSGATSQSYVQPAPQYNPICNHTAPHVSTFGTTFLNSSPHWCSSQESSSAMDTPVNQGRLSSVGVNIRDKERVQLGPCQLTEKFIIKQKEQSHPGIPNLTPIGPDSTNQVHNIQPEVEESWFELDSPTTATSLSEKVAVLVTALTSSPWKRSILDKTTKNRQTQVR